MSHWLTNYSKIFSAKSQLIEWLINFEIHLLAVKNYSGNSDLDNEIKNCVYELGSGRRSLDLRCSHLVRPGSHRRYGTSMDLLSYSGTVQARVYTDRLSGIAFQNLIWPANLTGSSSLFEVTVTYFNDEWQSIKTSALWMTAIALLIDKMVPPCIKYVHVRPNRTTRGQWTAILFGCVRLFQPSYIFILLSLFYKTCWEVK